MIRKFQNILPLVLFFMAFGCSSDDAVVDDMPPDSFPILKSIKLSGYLFDTDTISISGGTRTPDDPIDLQVNVKAAFQNSAKAQVKSIRCIIRREGSSTILKEQRIPLDGTSLLASETIYLRMKRGDVGDYTVEVSATDSRDLELNSLITKFKVLNGQAPPVLSDLHAPDTLTVPATDPLIFEMKVKVTDPSGPKDIQFVIYDSFKPNGQKTTGSPFSMYPSGKNDGNYLRTNQLISTSEKGKYKFEFQAFDYGNLPSNVITHYIVVK